MPLSPQNYRWIAGGVAVLTLCAMFYRYGAQETGWNPGYWVDESLPVKIIHIKNWHWIPKASFAIDQRDSDPDLTDEQIDERYAKFLDDLEELQKEQSVLIRQLASRHGLPSAFYEGVTPDNLQAFQNANDRVKRIRRLEGELESYGDTAETREIRRKLEAMILELREERLQLGAIGRLIREGDMDAVIPLESTKTLDVSNPVTEKGQIQFNAVAMKAREVEMAHRLLAAGPVAIVLLGGDHDLTEVLESTGLRYEYERTEVPTYLKLAK